MSVYQLTGHPPGTYSVRVLWCKSDRVIIDRVEQAGQLSVVQGDYFGSGKLTGVRGGPLLVNHSWQLESED